MKLYATTTSERASKGQGGNSFLKTQYKVIDREKVQYTTLLTYDKDKEQAKFEIFSHHFDNTSKVYENIIFFNKE